jgi:hypothetical protein
VCAGIRAEELLQRVQDADSAVLAAQQDVQRAEAAAAAAAATHRSAAAAARRECARSHAAARSAVAALDGLRGNRVGLMVSGGEAAAAAATVAAQRAIGVLEAAVQAVPPDLSETYLAESSGRCGGGAGSASLAEVAVAALIAALRAAHQQTLLLRSQAGSSLKEHLIAAAAAARGALVAAGCESGAVSHACALAWHPRPKGMNDKTELPITQLALAAGQFSTPLAQFPVFMLTRMSKSALGTGLLCSHFSWT